jgi:hypothetical protein
MNEKPEWLDSIKTKDVDYIEAHLFDGDMRTIPIGDNRKRWAALADVLENLDWQNLEGYNAEGQLVWTWARTEKQQDSPEDVQSKIDSLGDDRDAQLLRILTQAQRMVLAEGRQSQAVLVQGYRALADTLIDRIGHLEEKHAESIERMEKLALRIQESMTTPPEQDSGGSGNDTILTTVLKRLVESVPPEALGNTMSSLMLPAHGESDASSGETD